MVRVGEVFFVIVEASPHPLEIRHAPTAFLSPRPKPQKITHTGFDVLSPRSHNFLLKIFAPSQSPWRCPSNKWTATSKPKNVGFRPSPSVRCGAEFRSCTGFMLNPLL